MHDCLRTNEDLLDFLLGEAGGAEGLRVLKEAEACESCSAEMSSIDRTLGLFDSAAEAATPGETFWPGYEERLVRRMSQVFPLGGLPTPRHDYRVTLLEDEGLARRLVGRLRDVARDSQLTWPRFKKEPLAFTKRFAAAYADFFWNFISQRNVALGTSLSFVVVLTCVAGLIALERLRLSHKDGAARDDVGYELIGMLPKNSSVPDSREKPEQGSPGVAKGEGGGSLPEQLRPRGGGGGGNNESKPDSYGKLPPGEFLPQIVTPSPHPPAVKNPELAVLPHLDADPVLFPPDYRQLPFGNPRSQATDPSSGTGSGGGIGAGADGGVGPGRGGGYGPGEGGNTGGGLRRPGGGGPGDPGGPGVENHSGILTVKNVTRRAAITSKPEPGFTEEARKNSVTGTVKLRLALRADGTVTDITVVKGLPDGLTERAIQAAKSIKFIPAQKDGRNVSQWVTIEYNFNIY